MVFQSYALYPHMSVRQNLSFGLENINTPRAQIAAKVTEVATMLQIDKLLDRRPKDLSGGQRQRVAIGRAVVREPRVFLFDEPLSNLDAELRVDMRGEIAALHKRLGNTMIYVTHDQVEAMTMADKIAVLRDGVLEQFGAPLDLYNRPRNIFVAGFIGSPKMNFITGRVAGADRRVMELETGERIDLPGTGFAQRPGEAVTLGIRPNDLRPAGAGAITMAVRSVEQLGGESYVYGQLENDTPVTLHNPGQTSVRPGEVIAVDAVPGQLHLFDSETGQSLREETTR
ncbi:MAG: multiple sugar transport system ATP-binding protein [Rhodobacteraceae bacterium HLUCCA08]|nr:MAG: multiple sugar transport system ATP-binding protein [Rhodobacteraceae bacterium HLUCCA08]